MGQEKGVSLSNLNCHEGLCRPTLYNLDKLCQNDLHLKEH